MIKAKLTNGDLLFGISAENVRRLKNNEPIVFNLKTMGLEDRKVMIVYGETEQDIMAELINEDHVDTTTKINRE
jgi:hypothetical protein